jgi:hypothetical protein
MGFFFEWALLDGTPICVRGWADFDQEIESGLVSMVGFNYDVETLQGEVISVSQDDRDFLDIEVKRRV